MLPRSFILKDFITGELVPRLKRRVTGDPPSPEPVQTRNLGTTTDTFHNDPVGPPRITPEPRGSKVTAAAEAAVPSPHHGKKMRPNSNDPGRTGGPDGLPVEAPHTRDVDVHGREFSDMDATGKAEGDRTHAHPPAVSQTDPLGETMATEEDCRADGPSGSTKPGEEECSCRRTGLYLWKQSLCCARADRSWPFSRGGLRVSSSSEALPAGPGGPSPRRRAEAPPNGSDLVTSTVEIKPPKATAAAADRAPHQAPPSPLSGAHVKREEQGARKPAAGTHSVAPAGGGVAAPPGRYGQPPPVSSGISSAATSPGPPAHCTRASRRRAALADASPRDALTPSPPPSPPEAGSARGPPPPPHEASNPDSPSSAGPSTPRHSPPSAGAPPGGRGEEAGHPLSEAAIEGRLGDGEQPPLPPPSDRRPSAPRGPAGTAEGGAPAPDSHANVMDEITAFRHDILLVDVLQDPELFGSVPAQSPVTRGARETAGRPSAPCRELVSRAGRAPLDSRNSVTPKMGCSSNRSVLDEAIEEEGEDSPWRGKRSSFSSPSSTSRTQPTIAVGAEIPLDANNNPTEAGTDSFQDDKAPVKPMGAVDGDKGLPFQNREVLAGMKLLPSKKYCRFYFSDSLSCMFKFCRFMHSPADGDEKFCMDTVMRFSQIPGCLRRASSVFRDYYHRCPPGGFFSSSTLTGLLRSLLRAGLPAEVRSVLKVCAAQQIKLVPQVLLELYNMAQEKGLTAAVPELAHLTAQLPDGPPSPACPRPPRGAAHGRGGAHANLSGIPQIPPPPMSPDGSPLTPPPGFHGNPLSAWTPSFPPPLATPYPPAGCGVPQGVTLANGIDELEVCSKQRDWLQLGSVLRALCQSSLPPQSLELLARRAAMALLTETHHLLPLPFEAFAEALLKENSEEPDLSTLGRIGVTLMVRYHQTHQWVKGQRVVKVLSSLPVGFSTLRSLLCSDRDASRCSLVTMATEHCLLCGNIEGALSTLRGSEWFLASGAWPCQPADLEKRCQVLIRLAERSSHRDAHEILSHLPGIREPHESVDVSQFAGPFNAQLQGCLDRQILPVACDLLDLMLGHGLEAEAGLLHRLLSTLGQKNLWQRARALFRGALNAGYYPTLAAPPGQRTLSVPPNLSKVEMMLSLEMVILANPAPAPDAADGLRVTVLRTLAPESVYLAARSRLLAAAEALQPRLAAVLATISPSKEHIFTLDPALVQLWRRHNRPWASGVWNRLS